MDDIQIILLAAGASTRMGTSKPLLDWHGETLIEFQIKKLLQTKRNLIVVLGSNMDEIKSVIDHFDVEHVANNDWKKGMGSSIGCGVKKFLQSKNKSSAVLIVTVDQPLVDIDYLTELLNAFEPNKNQIVVSESSNGWSGIPAIFDSAYFEELSLLDGDKGAKSIVNNYRTHVKSLKAQERLIDMDTVELYEELLKR